jgi:hypothetical protein
MRRYTAKYSTSGAKKLTSNVKESLRVLQHLTGRGAQEHSAGLRCHYFDKGRYEIELWLPGVIANDIADKFSDGQKGFFCAFMPPAFYD